MKRMEVQILSNEQECRLSIENATLALSGRERPKVVQEMLLGAAR